MSKKSKWEQFNEWYYYAHPLVQILVCGIPGGIIGGLIGMALFDLIW